MSTKLVLGDVAELKSGGPKMTVIKDKVPEGSKFVEAAWFSGAELKQSVFPREALKGHPAKTDETTPAKPEAAKPVPAPAPAADAADA